jgi:hypothetical protein
MRFVKVASEAHLHVLMSGERLAFPSSIFPHSQVAIALPHYCPFQHVYHARVDTRQRATGLSKSFSLLQSWSRFQGQGRPTTVAGASVAFFKSRSSPKQHSVNQTIIASVPPFVYSLAFASHYWRHVATRSMDNTKCPSSWDEAKR